MVLAPGTRTIKLADAAEGWKNGDVILIPGTAASADQDEVREIRAVGEGGRRIELDRSLAFHHFAPPGVSIPVGNLTRNIEVVSLDHTALAARGHVLFMHTQTGVLVDRVAFRHLGRTDAKSAHTEPAVNGRSITKHGTDDNTIGRYAVHFHVRSGARVETPAHVVRRSVMAGSRSGLTRRTSTTSSWIPTALSGWPSRWSTWPATSPP